MNPTKTRFRTVLAAAAAGALVLGSAGGATAAPDKAKGPKAKTSAAATTKLQSVDIKRHKRIDLADVNAETALKLRATVRYSKKVSKDDALQEVSVSLAVFDKKVNGTKVTGSESDSTKLALKSKSRDRKNQFYAGSALVAGIWSETQIGDLAAAVETNGKAYICVDSVDESFDKYSMQTRKRLGTKADGTDIMRKTVRDCVKVVNTADAK